MSAPLAYRLAHAEDLETLVAMLADDSLGQQREDARLPLAASYQTAFSAIDSDPNQELTLACRGQQIVGMLQLSFIPYLTYQGSWRCQVEGVRVASAARGQGIGQQLLSYAIQRAQERQCHVIQLTSDKQRPEALRFYEQLGFVASHEGFKRHFKSAGLN